MKSTLLIPRASGNQEDVDIKIIPCYDMEHQAEGGRDLARWIFANTTAEFVERFECEWERIRKLSSSAEHTMRDFCLETTIDKARCNGCNLRFKCWTDK